ncbi:unnamed protein product [Sphagnum compactum]
MLLLFVEPHTKPQSLIHAASVDSATSVPKPTPRLSKSYTNDTNSSITQEDLTSNRFESHTSLEHETSSQISSQLSSQTSNTETSDSFNKRKEFWDTLDEAKRQAAAQDAPPVPKPRHMQRDESKSIETDTSSIRDIPDFKQDTKEDDSYNVDDRLEDESFPISERYESDVSESLKSHDKNNKKQSSSDEKHDKDSISVSLKGEFVERFGEHTESDTSEHDKLQPHKEPKKLKDIPGSGDADDNDNDDGNTFDKPAAFYIGDKSDNIITRSATEKRSEFAFDNAGYQLSMDDTATDSVGKTDYLHEELEIYDDKAINIEGDSEFALEMHFLKKEVDEDKLETEAIIEEIELEHAAVSSVEKSEIETSEKKNKPTELDVKSSKGERIDKADVHQSKQKEFEIETLGVSKDKAWKPVLHSPIEKIIVLEKPVEIVGEEITTAKATAIEVIKETSVKSQVTLEKVADTPKDLKTQEMAVDQAFEEIKESLDAVQEQLIEVVKDGKLIKQSPSEFEFSFVPHEQVLEAHPEEQISNQESSQHEKISLIKIQAPSESEDSSIRQDTSSADESFQKLDVTRRTAKHHTSTTNRWSVTDPETSSGESQYQSFEKTDSSRPQSSDIENLLQYTGSEYETACSQSTIPRSGATEYHSAISTLHSHTTSMKSFDSESSGNLGSIEASEASETLVPSQMEECEADIILGGEDEELMHDDSNRSDSFEEKQPGILLEAEPDKKPEPSGTHLKRSHEMIFTEDIRSSSIERLDDIKRIEDQTKLASSIEDVKFGSLEDGSLLSMSLSSASNIETVMENMPESGDIIGSLIGSFDSGKIYLSRSADDAAATTPVEIGEHERIESLTMTSSIIQEPFQTETTDVNTQISTNIVSNITQEESEPNKRRGHRRNDSTSVHPAGLIKGGTEEGQSGSFDSSELDDEMIVHEDEPHATIPVSTTLSAGEREESSDSDYDRYETEYARSYRSPTVPQRKKDKSIIEETKPDLEVRRRSPSHSIIETIVEDVHAELEEHPPIERRVSQNIQNVPDIQVSEEEDHEPLPKTLRQEIEERTAFSSVQYAQQIEYKMTEEQYQEIIDKKYRDQEIERYGGYDDDGYVDKPDSPGSDSFEMLEQPDISDEFVIVEEVAKEAHEFDTEGKGVGIQKVKREKKHDEDVERLLVRSAPASTDAAQVYAHHDDVPFDFEESPPIDPDHESTGVSTRDIGNGYPLEGSKRWVEMQLHDAGDIFRKQKTSTKFRRIIKQWKSTKEDYC